MLCNIIEIETVYVQHTFMVHLRFQINSTSACSRMAGLLGSQSIRNSHKIPIRGKSRVWAARFTFSGVLKDAY